MSQERLRVQERMLERERRVQDYEWDEIRQRSQARHAARPAIPVSRAEQRDLPDNLAVIYLRAQQPKKIPRIGVMRQLVEQSHHWEMDFLVVR